MGKFAHAVISVKSCLNFCVNKNICTVNKDYNFFAKYVEAGILFAITLWSIYRMYVFFVIPQSTYLSYIIMKYFGHISW